MSQKIHFIFLYINVTEKEQSQNNLKMKDKRNKLHNRYIYKDTEKNSF